MLRAALFALGLCLTVAGVFVWFGPGPAMVLAGVELAALMWMLESASAATRPKKPKPEEVLS